MADIKPEACVTLSIGELGRRAGAKVETIRYYERIGLLPAPARTEGNYRAYGEAALNRMSFIRRARDLGFSIEQVRDLLALSDRRDQSCATVDELTRVHLAEVERKIADLEALRRELSALLSQCRQGTISTCLIIEALAPTKA